MPNNIELFTALCQEMKYGYREGFQATYSDQITLFNTIKYQELNPTMYEPGLFITLSGHKRGYINDYLLETDAENYLLLTTPYPVACEAFASSDVPLRGLYIKLQPEIIVRLVESFKSNGYSIEENSELFPVGFDITVKTKRLEECTSRILTVLSSKIETDILLAGMLEEIYFLLLKSPQGQILINFIIQESTYYKIAKAVEYINTHFNEKLSIERLAEISGMSISTFHRAFKNCITDSPLQYLKKIRLNRAKNHILKESQTISEVAFKVGYESIPQFSREFKRYFGFSPSKVVEVWE